MCTLCVHVYGVCHASVFCVSRVHVACRCVPHAHEVYICSTSPPGQGEVICCGYQIKRPLGCPGSPAPVSLTPSTRFVNAE